MSAGTWPTQILAGDTPPLKPLGFGDSGPAFRLYLTDSSITKYRGRIPLQPQKLRHPPSVPAMQFIDLKSQYKRLKTSIDARIQHVLEHGQYILGPEVAELEDKLAAFTGAKYCITVASGTDALLISLLALGIRPGDEVVTTPFSFAATAEVIALLGAILVFVDIEPDTCNIDAAKIEPAITTRTRAIMPVCIYGQPPDIDEINRIAVKHSLPVIEDGAQSFGAQYKGRKSGNLTTIGCTSFFPSEPLGCYGDGGAIFTSNDDSARACRELWVHGQSERYVHTRIGIAGRMDTLQCAIVLAKLEQFEWEITRRRELGAFYNELVNLSGVERVQQRAERTSVFAQYTLMVDNRDAICASLKTANIPTAIHYPVPLNEQPAYKAFSRYATPNASLVSRRVVSLPMSPELSADVIQDIVHTVATAIDASRTR